MIVTRQTGGRQPGKQPHGLKVIEGEGRTMPHSLEAEEYVLSMCMLDGADVVRRCKEAGVQPRHFYDTKHGIIFACVLELVERGVQVDAGVVAEELKTRGELETVGGYAFLTQVSGRLATTAQAGFYIDKVIELAILRRIIQDGKAAVEACYNFSGDLPAFTGDQAERFVAIADFVRQRERKVTQKAAAAAAREEALAVAAGHVDKSRWLHWPSAKLDANLLPFDTRQEDWLILLAAPPSGGKSAGLRWLAGHWLRGGKKGVVFLLETSRKRWLQALAASFAGVNLRELEDTAKLFPQKFDEFRRALAEVEGWMEERLWIFDDVTALEDITRTVREVDRMIREREMAEGLSEAETRGLDFVVGDYLQIVTTRTQFLKRTEELAHITRSLKQLHRRLDVPGFWGAQITREARNEGRRPTLADLGESKSLEEASDRVEFLHVPTNDSKDDPQEGRRVVTIEMLQRKSRNGPKDIGVVLEHDRPAGQFRDPGHKNFAPGLTPAKGPVSKKDFM